MKNPFSPVFLVSLFLLSAVHSLDIVNHQVLQILTLSTFVFSLLLFVFKRPKISYVLITLAIGLLLTTQFVIEKNHYHRLKALSFPQDQYISLQGRLISFPDIRTDHSIIFLETKFLEFDREKLFKKLNIRIKVMGDLTHLYKGDAITVSAKVYSPSFNVNFYPNSMEDYLLAQKNHFNGYCKSARMVNPVERTSPFWRVIGAWRNKIREVIEKKGSDKKGIFLQAILIGERGKLTNTQEDQLLNAGIFHLLAISGAHIGMIALLCLKLLKLLRVASRNRYVITGIILIVFLVLSGMKISAERAVLMALLIFIARILFLEINIFNIISFCGLILLARNPAEFLDAGFILTFTLTAAIVIGRKVFLRTDGETKAVTENTDTDNDNENDNGRKRIFGRLRASIRRKVLPWLGELVSANLSASLMALPLSLYFFKRYSFAGFFAGLLLIPLTGLILGLSFLLIPLAPLSSFFSGVLLAIIDIPLRLFFSIAAFFSDTIDLSIFRASPSLVWVVLIFTGFYLLSILPPVKIQKKPLDKSFVGSKLAVQGVLAVILLLVLIFISVPTKYYAPANLEVFFLDVGQGDAQVVVFPGGDALLVDGGGAYFSDFQVGRQIVLPFILQKRIRIKWIAVSHFHPDHSYGIAEIIRIVKPDELWISAEAPEEPGYQKLFKALPSSTKVKKIIAPFRQKIGACTVEFLYPHRFIKEKRAHNNHSQVIKISGLYHSFLFTGDIEKEVERILPEEKCAELRAAVIKVPHHGSASSSEPGFLRCVKPRLAIFSYAAGNRFGFPHQKVLKAYQNQKIRYLATAGSGGIRVVSSVEGLRIDPSK